ncbi:CRISPR-associated helicase/endonuclease Cas3 [Corynebacterium liangguodongii]|uniref:CRISPR-associated helicase/endonuclease Cas3 n=1 Tax=Corynebacterium liangguodongii TaxID=2079535 RepID=A0A2S0WH93_9CORY|nr:CRISPR-associated helicase/endonuclease Cas3 [Corynebacterium liangguodongii]PWB99243.1 CRISPR-associated helicase Cas3' [Corynebacterium liangguodongii]
MLDTACAAAAVYDLWVPDTMKRWFADKLRVPEGDVRAIYIFLAGVHDVGKATVTFQCQGFRAEFEALFSAVRDAGLPGEMNVKERELRTFPHGVASGIIVGNWLSAHGCDPRLSQVVDAHHGVASSGDLSTEKCALDRYPRPWKDVHEELIGAMAELTGVEPALERACGSAARRIRVPVLQLLTGLVVMADWIASDQDAFPMVVDASQVERLRRGLELTDLTGPIAFRGLRESADQIFNRSFGFSPRTVQRELYRAAAALDGPAIVILEAETGAGKTEAALAATEAMGIRAQGIYFAAPTMATANGLLERVMDWAARLTEGGEVSSLYLAHSKNQLSEPFRHLRYYGVGRDHGDAGSVVASTWMSGRRRGLLSNIVVGTIDQVLMMALRQRYSMLRHVALAGKVVIFDEVHAFDTYTSDYLERTIRWLSYYGASVIIMSATLPPSRRQALARAYTEVPLPEVPDAAYPLITVATEDSARVIPVEPAPTNLAARVRIIPDSLSELVAELEGLLVDGGCVLIIANTIERAQETYRKFKERYPQDVELHHAGFMALQRVAKEDALRAALGPTSHRGSGRPHLRIVVATQVAEQSLDIDADVLITDIAPMDLIVQRIGRLHRHKRPDSDRPAKLLNPQVLIRGVVKRGPVPQFNSGAAAVYGRKLLLATLANLPETFRRPDDIAGLVRTVYSDGPEIPSEWRDAWEEAMREDDQRVSTAHGRAATFMIPEPEDTKYFSDIFSLPNSELAELDCEEKGNAQVRDAEPTVEVIPIRRSGEGSDVYYACGGNFGALVESEEPSYPVARHLSSSTVRLPARVTRFNRDFEAVVGGLEELTPVGWRESNLLKGQLALPLDPDGEITLGRFTLRYTDELGIEIASDDSLKSV